MKKLMSFRMFSSVKLTIIQNISLKLSVFGLKPVILSSNEHDNDSTKHKESQYKEEPEKDWAKMVAKNAEIAS